MKETALVRDVLRALSLIGVWAWRMNSGTMVIVPNRFAPRARDGGAGGARIFKGAPAGTPDIFAISSDGKLCGLECKVGKNKQSPAQIAWEQKAISHNVNYVVIRSVSDAIKAMRDWK